MVRGGLVMLYYMYHNDRIKAIGLKNGHGRPSKEFQELDTDFGHSFVAT